MTFMLSALAEMDIARQLELILVFSIYYALTSELSALTSI